MADFHEVLSPPGARGERSERIGPAKTARTRADVMEGSGIVGIVTAKRNLVSTDLRDGVARSNLRR